MASLYDPQPGGGITQRGIRITEDGKVSHEPPVSKPAARRKVAKKEEDKA